MWLKSSIVVLIIVVSSVNCFPESRVVNGTNSDITDYPFMVSLTGPKGTHLCGGTIIAPSWILTAAHCLILHSESEISIKYGTTILSADNANVVGVKRIIRHKKFYPFKFNPNEINPFTIFPNDIAVLELEVPLAYNYKNITLPAPYFEVPQTLEGTPGILLGWGYNVTGAGVMQDHLQEANLKIYSDEECQMRYEGFTSKTQICGGVDKGGKGQCSGDSGGPLLYQGSIQLGIVSWSYKPCTAPSYPGIYTKVSHYIGWIKKQINN